MAKHKFPYLWYLKDGFPAKGIKANKCKVFGTFICGGGSSMGYKLAGYNHLGGVEIDPRIANIYRINHHPKYLYLEDIRKFNQRTDLPDELYNLDVLDGSPPCSSFSTAGNRDKDWGKKKVFREGQANQRLDDLVFEYVKTIKKLQPKIALLENVKGLIKGSAKAYAKKINEEFISAGYQVQLFLLNAASMGVPQKRERVFFIGLRKDIDLPKLKLNFNEPAINFGEISHCSLPCDLTKKALTGWQKAKQGKPIGSYQSDLKLCDKKVANTIRSAGSVYHSTQARKLSTNELCQIGSYPLDYFFDTVKPKYLIGMSVPPVMIAQIAHQIYLQWLSKIESKDYTPPKQDD